MSNIKYLEKQRLKAEKRKTKMKLLDLLDSRFNQTLSAFMQEKINTTLAWQLSEVADKSQEHVKKFHANRKALIDRHGGVLNEAKTEYVFPEVSEGMNGKEKYDEDYKELVEIDVEMPTIAKSAIDREGSVKGEWLFILKPLIK